MSWSRLPPVGRRIRVSRDPNSPEFMAQVFGPGQVHSVNSGTAALATALLAARALLPDVKEPKVLMPAYGCPDLVSAADFAGVEPLLIDLEPNRPWMSLQALSSMLDENVIAVVAVALFGIREQLHEIARLVSGHPAILIEDNAQYFDSSRDASNWVGDALVFSLGRGKPASVLGGGLVVSRTDQVDSTIQRTLEPKPTKRFPEYEFIAKATAYNILRQPLFYGLVCRVPSLNLGATVYKPLQKIARFDDLFMRHAACNLRNCRSENQTETMTILRNGLRPMFDDGTFTDLAQECGDNETGSLIRLPILAKDRHTRDAAVKIFERFGLGVSTMYGVALPEVRGLERRFQGGTGFPAAEDFACRLLTLPVERTVALPRLKRAFAVLREEIDL